MGGDWHMPLLRKYLAEEGEAPRLRQGARGAPGRSRVESLHRAACHGSNSGWRCHVHAEHQARVSWAKKACWFSSFAHSDPCV